MVYKRPSGSPFSVTVQQTNIGYSVTVRKKGVKEPVQVKHYLTAHSALRWAETALKAPTIQ